MNKFSIKSHGEETITFSTLSQLQKWVEREQESWRDYQNKINSFTQSNNTHPQIWKQVSQDLLRLQLSYIEKLNQAIKEQNEDSIKSQLNQISANNFISSKSSQSQKVFEVVEYDVTVSFLMFSIFHPRGTAERIIEKNKQSFNDQQFKEIYGALQKAYLEVSLFEKGFKGSARVEKAAFQKLKGNLNEYLTEISVELNNAEELNAKIQSDHEEAEKRFQGRIKRRERFAVEMMRNYKTTLEDTTKHFKEELALQIPVTYWSKKAKDHRLAAYIWGASFVLIVILLLTCSFAFIENIIQNALTILPSLADQPLSLFFLITFPAFLVVWLLKIISRNIITNFAHMHEAYNRSIMTQTFLALVEENKASDNDRILILNALFQPMTGSSDDGSPPHWFELMMERIKKP